jgi:hypothetical protein
MEPIGVEIGGKKGYVIIHRCKKCGEVKRNKAAVDGVQTDDMDAVIALSLRQY